MKKTVTAVAITLGLAMGQSAWAAAKSVSSGGGSHKFGLGAATSGMVSTGGAVTAVYALNEQMLIQAFFGLSAVSPFTFGLSGVLKYTLFGTQAAGFHVGGGAGIGLGGAVPTFGMMLIGNAGIHTNTWSDNIQVHLDAGTTLGLSGAAFFATLTNLGFSVVYFLD